MNLLNILNDKNVYLVEYYYNCIKTYARDKFIESWKTRLARLSKCDLYQPYKVTFEQEKCLAVLPPNLAIVLCKFRTSNHKLEVETGRHVRPIIPRFERKCKRCNLNKTSNEFHHLLVCTKFETLRLCLIPENTLQESTSLIFLI